ncbi:kinase-like domain-containing protein [Mycena crocata]|nr:kinase-like domain-containing protein [Mycena crocata]
MDSLLCRPHRGSVDYSGTPVGALQARIAKARKVFLAWRSKDVEPKRIRTLPVGDNVQQFLAIPWTRVVVLLEVDAVYLRNWESTATHKVSVYRDDELFMLAVDVFWVEALGHHVLIVSRGRRRVGERIRSELLLFAIDEDNLSTTLLTTVKFPFAVSSFALTERHLCAVGTAGIRTYYLQSVMLAYNKAVSVAVRAFVRISPKGTLASSSFAIMDDSHFLIANPTGLTVFRLSDRTLNSIGKSVRWIRPCWEHCYNTSDLLSRPPLGPILANTVSGEKSVTVCGGSSIRCVFMAGGSRPQFRVAKQALNDRATVYLGVTSGCRIGMFRPSSSSLVFSTFRLGDSAVDLHPLFYGQKEQAGDKGTVTCRIWCSPFSKCRSIGFYGDIARCAILRGAILRVDKFQMHFYNGLSSVKCDNGTDQQAKAPTTQVAPAPVFRYRQELDEFLGAGRYSRVVSAFDRCTDTTVALKIMCRRGEFRVTETEFNREVRSLSRLLRLPLSSTARFCELKDHFVSIDHFFMVFDVYGDNLATVLTNTRLSSMPVYQAKEISRQLIQGVRYLHENGIIHSNLNPTNIVFLSNATATQTFYGMDNAFHSRTILKSTEIRIVDFGSVHDDSITCTGTVGLSGYRAPEVIMDWSWTKTIDHFAIGCIIAEMVSSVPLLPRSHGSLTEDIAVLDRLLGPFSKEMVVDIERRFPTAFDHRSCVHFQFSHLAANYFETAKSIEERVEDRDAARLVARLTNLDPLQRGELRNHENARFVATYEM